MTTVPHPSERHLLSDDEREQFLRDGYLVRRGVLDDARLEPLRQVFSRTVDQLARRWQDEGFVSDLHEDLPFDRRFAAIRAQLPAKFPTSWRRVLVSPEVYALWQQPELLGIARSVVGDEVYAHGVWNGRPREPHNHVQKVLWHQDAHYYKAWDPTDGRLLTMWMPLVPVDAESGCLEVAPRSHTRGWIERTHGYNGLFTVPDHVLADFQGVAVNMDPGDVLIFSDTTLHQSLDNTSDRVRWSIDIRFAEATGEVISKTPRGYWCFSASDPARVESYEEWASRYDYDRVGLDAELENAKFEGIDLDRLARKLQISRTEFEVF